MIDEERTLEIYGYTSSELSCGSHKPIIVVCEICGQYRKIEKRQYRDICHPCSHKKIHKDDPTVRERQSIATKKRYEDDPTLRERQSISMCGNKNWNFGKCLSEKTKNLIRKKMSGENAPNWQGGISFGEYCPKFNNDIKQQIRNKYDNCDYISGIHASICNPHRKLDVHHVDYNKLQGCDEHEWILIPLSHSNHVRTNYNRQFWNTLFTYSLQYDGEYYREEDRNFDVFSYINNSNNIIGAN